MLYTIRNFRANGNMDRKGTYNSIVNLLMPAVCIAANIENFAVLKYS
jgi:hypothetical protein